LRTAAHYAPPLISSFRSDRHADRSAGVNECEHAEMCEWSFSSSCRNEERAPYSGSPAEASDRCRRREVASAALDDLGGSQPGVDLGCSQPRVRGGRRRPRA
jgi:hypothetical protein